MTEATITQTRRGLLKMKHINMIIIYNDIMSTMVLRSVIKVKHSDEISNLMNTC